MHTNDEDFDSVLLGSIFRSQHWSPLQQLSLALAWDRVDLAASVHCIKIAQFRNFAAYLCFVFNIGSFCLW